MKSMSIARQFVILVVAFVVAMPAAVGGLGYILYRNGAAARRISAEANRESEALFALVAAIGREQSTTQRLIREKDPDVIEKLMDESKGGARTVLDRIRDAGEAEGEVASEFETLRRANENAVEFFLHGDIAQSQETVIELSNPAFERLLTSIGKTQDDASRKEAAAAAATEASNNRAQFTVFGVVGFVLLGLIGFSVKMVRGITASLCRTVDELRLASECTASAASQISSGSQALADSSSEQAASIEETSAASEEISSMTRQNDQNSRSAADKMGQAAQHIADANQRLEEMVRSMTEINTAGEGVSKIIKTIDEIAFQTNILALNAAVEAARAGEAGMGFAVVADEVRNLAQRCARAAQDTSGMIADSIGKTRDGKAKLDRVAGAIRSVTESAQEVKGLVDHIQNASDEQSKGIQQVSRALSKMQEVTSQTAAGAQASAAAGQELSSQSEALKATVARLAAMVYGTGVHGTGVHGAGVHGAGGVHGSPMYGRGVGGGSRA